MNTLAGHVRDLAKVFAAVPEGRGVPDKAVKKPEEIPKGINTGNFRPLEARLFFMAPDDASTKTITPQGNFQWIGYELLFLYSPTMKHYMYRTPLWAYGEESEGGSQVVIDAEGDTGDLTVDEVKKSLEKYRTPYPDNVHSFYYNVTDYAPGSKFNPDLWKKTARKYTREDFINKFRKSGFYKKVNKDTKKLENP